MCLTFAIVQCDTVWFLHKLKVFLLMTSERAVSCLPPCANGVAKSKEAIDSGLWRVGRDEGMLHQHTYTHTLGSQAGIASGYCRVIK